MSMTSCSDFLNDNRYPLSSQTVNSEFWSNPVNVENQISTFYNDYYGYGNGASTNGTFYYSWLSDDQCGRMTSTTGHIRQFLHLRRHTTTPYTPNP